MGWEADLRLLTERVSDSLFTRPEPRATFADLVRGLLADVPRKNSWQRRSCGAGTKGERYYDWAAVAVTVKDQPPAEGYSL